MITMHRRKVITVVIILVVVIVGAVVFKPAPRIQVVGNLPPQDLAQIQKLVQHERRFWILPELEWDNVYHLGYVCRSVREYEAQRILWVDVKADGSVEVFAGVSKDVIRSEGHAIDLRKEPNWKITGYGYWASSNVAPHDIHVPPSP